jgi:hypothetical protein
VCLLPSDVALARRLSVRLKSCSSLISQKYAVSAVETNENERQVSTESDLIVSLKLSATHVNSRGVTTTGARDTRPIQNAPCHAMPNPRRSNIHTATAFSASRKQL